MKCDSYVEVIRGRLMVTGVEGNDRINVSWIYSGSQPTEHHCTVDFSFQAEPIIEPFSTPDHFAGILSFTHRPPFEHITFLAVDRRTMTEYQRLAYAVLVGDVDTAIALADAVRENYS